MEEGKRLALAYATGEYIVFVDADNEFTHSDYLELAVRALEKTLRRRLKEDLGIPARTPPEEVFRRLTSRAPNANWPACFLTLTPRPLSPTRWPTNPMDAVFTPKPERLITNKTAITPAFSPGTNHFPA